MGADFPDPVLAVSAFPRKPICQLVQACRVMALQPIDGLNNLLKAALKHRNAAFDGAIVAKAATYYGREFPISAAFIYTRGDLNRR